MPKISIITTTYKHQHFIKDTIESVLSQTFSDWELLIWDDSPDYETWNIIESYVNKYPDKIKAWHHSRNKWIVDNMNFLLEKVSDESEYITFLEWDDKYNENNLQEKINFLNENSSINFIYNSYVEIDINSNIKSNNPFIEKINSISLKDFIISWWNFIKSFWTITLKKNLLNEFYPLFSPNWDKMFWLLDFFTYMRFLPWKSIWFLDKKIFFYRNHLNNFSWFKNNVKLFDENKAIYEYFLNNCTDNKLEKLLKYRLSYLYSIHNISINSKINSLKFLLRTFKYSIKNEIFNRIKIFIRILVPKFVNNFFISLYAKK
jgi:glycosyltransferase involved in cell wall biosynthesis